MCNKEHLVAYLYGELSGRDRAEFDAHLTGCAACRQELKDLGLTRQHLASWSPPEPRLGVGMARARRDPPRRRFGVVPDWSLAAAAAVLVLAGAAAIANIEIRYGSDGFVVRTGWAAERGASGPAEPGGAERPAVFPAQAASPAPSSEQTMKAIAALQARLDDVERQQAASASRPLAVAHAGTSAAELRRWLAESEARQRTEVALQIAQIWKDFNAVRARDFARVQEVVGRAQGQTNFQLKQHRDSIESLYRVSFQQK
jgi:hypothetical protein